MPDIHTSHICDANSLGLHTDCFNIIQAAAVGSSADVKSAIAICSRLLSNQKASVQYKLMAALAASLQQNQPKVDEVAVGAVCSLCASRLPHWLPSCD